MRLDAGAAVDARQHAQDSREEIRATMEEDGLHIFDGEDTQVLLYDSIEQIGDEDGYLFLGYGDRQTVVIPPAAFTRGESERQAFLSELRHMVHKRRTGVLEK